MPKLHPIQTSFAAGKISDRFLSQVDTRLYTHGCRELENYVSLAQGPLIKRSGMAYITTIPGTNGRIFGFPVARGAAYFVLVSNDGNVYVVSPNGRVFLPASNRVTNGNFINGANGWTVATAKDGALISLIGVVELMPGSHPSAYSRIEQQVTLANTNLQTIIVTCLSEKDADYNLTIGSTQGASDLYNVTGIRQLYYEDTFDPQTNTTIWVRMECPSVESFSSERTLDSIVINEKSLISYVNFAHPWDDTDIIQLQVGMPPGLDHMYFTCPNKEPQALLYNRSTDVWSFQAVAWDGAIPSPWAGNNWPRAQTFHQGRWWLGGTPNQPETFWGSRSGTYWDFNLTGTGPDVPISFTMAKKGAIAWMASVKNLLIGTEYGEHIITSKEGVITSSDVQANQQSAFGSIAIQAEEVGNRVLYVSLDGRKMRELGYQWTDDGWVSRDITFIAEDITANNYQFSEVVFARNPENLIVANTRNRQLLTATYERNNDIIGWNNHVTRGEIVSVGVVEFQGVSVIGALVNRRVNPEGNELYFEVFEDEYLLDSFTVLKTGGTEITGVTHLKNQTVSVITDGALHPDITLDANGNGTLQWEANEVALGFGYVARFQSLPFAPNVPEGSSAPMAKRWNQIFIRVVSSAKPYINNNLPPIRHPATPMNTREPLYTEDVMVTNIGWNLYADITVVQPFPLPTMITGIHGEMSVEHL